MQESDKGQFRELMVGAGELYGKEITKPLLRIYFNALEDLSFEQVEQSFTKHTKSTDQAGSFFPKPADLIRQINGTSKQNEQALDDKSEIAWHVIEGEMRRIGSHTSLRMEDRQALAAVKAIGGWKKICGLTISELTWAHKEFVAAYKNYERTDVNLLPDKLPGRIFLENNKRDQQGGMKSLAEGVQKYQQNFVENNKDRK
jgi:hypothetical protein